MAMARTTFRLPETNKLQKDELAAVKSTPWSMFQPKEPEVVFQEAMDKIEADHIERTVTARNIYIKGADLERYGLTRGCPRCDQQLAYGAGRTTKPHSAACRARILECLQQPEEGRRRIVDANERIDRATASF